MRVVVLGATGVIGSVLVDRLRERGIDVVAANRASGVDAYEGTGLAEVFAGADVVIDCMNVTTTSAKKAIDFFGTVARNVGDAATKAGVPHVVCLSIINAADPTINAKFGYYQGKAAQEDAYRAALAADRLTIVRSAQFFELAEQMMGTLRLGPVAAVPHMRCRPLSVADAAAALADVAVAAPAGEVEVAGPDVLDLADIGKAVARRSGSPKWVIAINFGGAPIRDGALVPEQPSVVASTTLGQWLDTEYAA
ncbi:NAD(P)H-binding protein [Gordonia sp. PKS22-38]|uniref:NAD(P)H-binding protein n=1 Tax=Gordonia prachuapensis TaxID=3115651 RepID=A0ABU7MQ09_9ACTN|nr:NAD(P)H-binding protein [Gordonia sp. PKS22-38]